MKKPNLFIVGAPKTGTTSLHYYLSQHPEIFMSERKEIHYFDTDLHKESDKFHGKKIAFPIRDRDSFMKCFKDSSNERYLGESTPLNLCSVDAAENIYNFNPEAKVVIILREPVSLIHSWHSQLLNNGDETETSFLKALEMENRRKKDWNLIPNTVLTPSMLYYRRIVSYTEQINRYLKYFPSKQIKVVFLDDMVNDIDCVYKDLLNFLGVDTSFKPDFNVKNKNSVVVRPKLHRLLFSTKKFKVKDYIPLRLKKKIIKLFSAITTQSKKRDPIDKSTNIKLKKEFYNEVVNLEELLTENELVKTDFSLKKKWSY